jgi:hypothetical protein
MRSLSTDRTPQCIFIANFFKIIVDSDSGQ